MSSTVIAEQIRAIPKSKCLEEVNTKLTELETLYNNYFEARGERYGDVERKADILRIVPLELQQKLTLDIPDMDNHPIQTMLNTVQNYIRNMTRGSAKMDIGAVAEGKTTKLKDEADVEEEYPEDLNYMGGKSKGKGKGEGIKGDCWNCGKTGHMAVNCKSKGKGKAGAKGSAGGYQNNN